ncbi:Xaa-Pro dipeptidase [Phycisphaerales bacterium]|nr:Xaa-Pro dipeptidase [Phycisphaerales bacterium]
MIRKKTRRRAAAGNKPVRFRLLPDPPVNHAARILRLRTLAHELDSAWTLINNPLDVAYLTGFLGGDSYLLLGPSGCTVISDFRYDEELRPVRKLADIHIRKGAMPAAVGDAFAANDIRRCLIQPEYVTLNEKDALTRHIGEGRSLIPAPGLVQKMRLIKDAAEVHFIRQAARIQEAALLAILPTLAPGQTELEVAGRLEAEMKARGSREPGFQTIIAARTNGSLPHYRPEGVTLARNQPLLIDWGAVYLGYHSDMTRTFSFGKWPAKVREIYQIVLDAQLAAAAALAPGKSTRQIDAVARDYIIKHGYGEAFGHGLGHGLGFNGHEEPRLTHMLAESTLQPGQVVTVEPGIYLPGIGGVRIEDDYLITDKGAENLCTLPKDLAWATL